MRVSLVKSARELRKAMAAYTRAERAFLGYQLDTRIGLARAAHGLTELWQLDDSFSRSADQLAAALGEARERQQREGRRIHQRALEVLARTREVELLVLRLHELTREIAAVSEAAHSARDPEELAIALRRVEGLATSIRTFVADATARGFSDLAAEGEALIEQVSLLVRGSGPVSEGRAPAPRTK